MRVIPEVDAFLPSSQASIGAAYCYRVVQPEAAKQRRIIPDELFGRGLKGSILSTHAHPSITMCPRNLSITTFWPSTLGLRSPSECGRTPGWVVGERLTSPHRGVCRAHPHPPHP